MSIQIDMHRIELEGDQECGGETRCLVTFICVILLPLIAVGIKFLVLGHV